MSITGEQVSEHRKSLKMSRNKYAEHVGLTPTKIHNIEHGRALRPEEEQILAQFIQAGGSPPAPSASAVPEVQGDQAADAPAPPVIPSGEGLAPVVLLDEEEDEDEEAVPVPLAEGAVPTEDGAAPTTWKISGRYDFVHTGYHISNSELSCFKRCRRKWYLAYYRELRLKTPALTGARAIGTRIHIALSAYYSKERLDPMEVLEATILEDRQKLDESVDVDALKELEQDADLSRAMLEGYFEWIRESGADEGLEVIGDEVVVEVPFCTAEEIMWDRPIILVGKMDLRARRSIDAARLFLDHKTTGSLTAPLRTLHLDEQMLHYHLLEYLEFMHAGMTSEEAEHEHSHGGLYNMLRKVKRTANAKPPFFDRIEVRHNTHELRSYYARVWGEVVELVALRRKLDEGMPHLQVAYPTPRRDCSWDCDFLPVCPMFDDGSAAEELLAEHYESNDPHSHYYPYGEREAEKVESSA